MRNPIFRAEQDDEGDLQLAEPLLAAVQQRRLRLQYGNRPGEEDEVDESAAGAGQPLCGLSAR
jgi:hypothetical protein